MKRSIRQKHLQLNNAGVSLIELIVAILILAVITAPLLRLFTSAARTNAVSTDNLNADTVAQNIMEAVKAYGIEGTSNQVKNVQISGATTCFGLPVNNTGCYGRIIIGDDDDTSGESDDIWDRDSVTGEYKMNEHKYKYHLAGIKEGSGTYDVDILFNAVDEFSARNNVDFYSLPLFNKGTVVLDPINKMEDDYIDARAVRNLAGQCVSYWRNQSALSHVPYSGATEEDVMASSSFIENIKRTLRINYYVDDSAKYRLEAYFDYTLISDSIYGFSYVPQDTISCSEMWCDAVSDHMTDTIYVIFIPFPYMSKTAFSEDLDGYVFDTKRLYPDDGKYLLENAGTDEIKFDGDHDEVIFKNEVDGARPDMFICVQYNSDMIGDATNLGTIKTTTQGSRGSEVTFFSQAQMTSRGDLNYNPIREDASYGVNDYTIVKTLDPGKIDRNRIVNVTVTVKSEDATREISSTIAQ